MNTCLKIVPNGSVCSPILLEKFFTDEQFFIIDHNVNRRLAHIELRGFWKLATLDAFMAAANEVLQDAKRVGLSPGDGHILISVVNMPVQDKTLTDRLSHLIPMFGMLSKKVAIVTSSSSMARLQARRLAGDNARLFENENDALEWLYDE